MSGSIFGGALAALEARLGPIFTLLQSSLSGLLVRTPSGAFTARTIEVSGGGIQLSNGDGQAGNPTLSLSGDLAAIEALGGVGLAVRTGDNTWEVRALQGTANRVTISNGNGSGGNPLFTTPQDTHTGARPTFAGVTLVGGGLRVPTRLINTNGNHAVSSADFYIAINTGAGSPTLDLPPAASNGGMVLIVRRVAGGSNYVIDPNGAEQIDAGSTLTVSDNNARRLVCDGTRWDTW